MNCILGLDLGQSNDFTAISVLDIIPTKHKTQVPDVDPELNVPRTREIVTEGPPLTYHVRHLERLPIGTPYPAQVARVKETLCHLPAGTDLVVDNTGVGRPVTDMIVQHGLHPICVTITGGNVVTHDGLNFNVPKRDIVGVIAVALQNKRMKIAAGLPYAKTLITELENFKVKIDPKTAHDSYEAWREGIHDDLVLSVGLAAWVAHFYYSQPRTEVYVLKDDYDI
jgi:hypothetical protein